MRKKEDVTFRVSKGTIYETDIACERCDQKWDVDIQYIKIMDHVTCKCGNIIKLHDR